jgi:outer membrane lipoprotein-sorting protein
MVVAAAGAADLESAEKQIIANWKKHKSATGKLEMTMNMEMGPVSMEGKGQGTFEMMRKGDKYLSRVDITTNITQKMGENENKMEQKMLMVVDGENAYTVMESMGQTTATKSEIDATMGGDPEAMLKELADKNELKLLPEEKIGEHKMFVIEAKPKEGAGTPGTPSKMVIYFDQDNGFMTKMVMYGPEDKPITTVQYKDVKYDVDINPDDFKFKAPEGVEIIDTTKS